MVADLVVTIAIVAVLGFGLAWLVGRVAERDKRKREAEGAKGPPVGRPLPDPQAARAPAGAPAGTGEHGHCPTCRTAYRADLAFCWACGRDKVSDARP